MATVQQAGPPRGSIGRCNLGRQAQLHCPGVQGDSHLAHRWLYEELGGLPSEALNATWEPRSTVTGERCPGIGDSMHQQYNQVMRYHEELAMFQALVNCNAPLVYVRMNDGERDALRRQHNRCVAMCCSSHSKEYLTSQPTVCGHSPEFRHKGMIGSFTTMTQGCQEDGLRRFK